MNDLRSVFAAMGRYLADPGPGAAETLTQELDWEPDRARLGIYGHHARVGVGNMLKTVFAGCREAVGEEAWTQLMRDYYASRPAKHYEVNRAGSAFPAFLAERASTLPVFLPQLAAFEWRILATYQATDELPSQVDGLSVNPSLETLQHDYRLCAYLAAKPREAAPQAGEEVALVWRHPETLRTRYMSATARTLLALKIVLEEIPLQRAAEEGAVPEAEIQRVLDEAVERGLLLRP